MSLVSDVAAAVAQCRAQRGALSPVWLVAGRPSAAVGLLRSVSLSSPAAGTGAGLLNVHAGTSGDLVAWLSSAAIGRVPASRIDALAAAGRVLGTADVGSSLGPVASAVGGTQAAVQAGAALDQIGDLDEDPAAGVPGLTKRLGVAHAAYEALRADLDAHGFELPGAAARRAAEAVAASPDSTVPNVLLVGLTLDDLPPVHRDLLAAIDARGRLRVLSSPTTTAENSPLTVIDVSDPDSEIRLARSLVLAAVANGTPPWRIAVTTPSGDGARYRRGLNDQLMIAGLPVAGRVARIRDTPAGRLVLGLRSLLYDSLDRPRTRQRRHRDVLATAESLCRHHCAIDAPGRSHRPPRRTAGGGMVRPDPHGRGRPSVG